MSTASTSPESACRTRWRWPETPVWGVILAGEQSGMMVEETRLGGVDVNGLECGNISFRGKKRLGDVL